MPRIDPLALLNCLSVLLGPDGGIKGTKEVDRLATLMTKFSKKLVSKCIYIQILKTTNTELLNQFMSTGGWDLIHIWLTDAIVAKNSALIQELLELLLLCPVDIARLKSNNNPKLVKGLSKEGSHQSVRTLACRLVDQWLKIVKEAVPSEDPAPTTTMPPNHLPPAEPKPEPEEPVKPKPEETAPEASTVSLPDLIPTISPLELPSHQQFHEKIHIQPVQLQILNKTLPGQSQPTQIKKQSFVVVSNASTNPQPQVPVYKITIRDGKQVLTKVETDAANIPKAVFADPPEVKVKEEAEVKPEVEVDTRQEEAVAAPEVVKTEEVTPPEGAVAVKSSDKENRDAPKKEEKTKDERKSHHSSSKSGSSSKHSSSSSRSSGSSSKHKSSSSSSRSSSKSSSRDKDRHHSSSRHSSSSSSKSKSEREREKEKERMKKDQAEKDKATLEKVQGQSISTKIGKIPKKKVEEEKPAERKTSTDSRDSSKENKTEAKKAAPQGVLEKKNISISIENRKNNQEAARPKTVKTFNSKFRSTGLEEEVKPPPPRTGAKKEEVKKVVVPPKVTMKRTSPLRETPVTDKRAKLSLEPPVMTPGDDKKGAIKLIAPKPKRESTSSSEWTAAPFQPWNPKTISRMSNISIFCLFFCNLINAFFQEF